jgi:hypothetical protein
MTIGHPPPGPVRLLHLLTLRWDVAAPLPRQCRRPATARSWRGFGPDSQVALWRGAAGALWDTSFRRRRVRKPTSRLFKQCLPSTVPQPTRPPSVGRPGGGIKLGPVAIKPPVAASERRDPYLTVLVGTACSPISPMARSIIAATWSGAECCTMCPIPGMICSRLACTSW